MGELTQSDGNPAELGYLNLVGWVLIEKTTKTRHNLSANG